jgi:hypothetical protein
VVFCLVYSSTLKVEVKCFTETWVGFHRATRRYISKDRTLKLYIYVSIISVIRETCFYLSHILQYRVLKKIVSIIKRLMVISVNLNEVLHIASCMKISQVFCCMKLTGRH